MQELTIRCACGRSMAPDYRRGPDAYRCGCGVRIEAARKQQGPASQCWFDECDSDATTKAPIRFCKAHEEETALLLAHLIARRDMWLSAGELCRPLSNYGLPAATAHTESSRVYFMRRESLIKIGYSGRVHRRAGALGATVLATIPGGPSTEAQMHRRFRNLRQSGEWFHPGAELIGYVNELRAADGEDPIHA